MSNPSTLAKRKQLLLTFGVLTVIGLLAVVGVSLTEEATPAATVTRPVDIKTKSYIAPGEKIDPEKAWRGVADSRLTGIEDKMSTLEITVSGKFQR